MCFTLLLSLDMEKCEKFWKVDMHVKFRYFRFVFEKDVNDILQKFRSSCCRH